MDFDLDKIKEKDTPLEVEGDIVFRILITPNKDTAYKYRANVFATFDAIMRLDFKVEQLLIVEDGFEVRTKYMSVLTTLTKALKKYAHVRGTF